MVKIGPFIFGRAKKIEEKLKASVDMGFGGKPKRKIFSIGEHTWRDRCKHFEQLAQHYPLFNQS